MWSTDHGLGAEVVVLPVDGLREVQWLGQVVWLGAVQGTSHRDGVGASGIMWDRGNVRATDTGMTAMAMAKCEGGKVVDDGARG